MSGTSILPNGCGDLVLHPQGQLLYTGGIDGSINVYSYSYSTSSKEVTFQHIQKLTEAHSKNIVSLSIGVDSEGRTLLASTSSFDNTCKLFLQDFSYSSTRTNLAESANTYKLTIPDIEDSSLPNILTKYSTSAYHVALTQEGTIVYTAGDINALRVISVEDPTDSPQLLKPYNNNNATSLGSDPNSSQSMVRTILPDPYNRYVATITTSGTVTIYDQSTSFTPCNTPFRATPCSASGNMVKTRLAWSPSGVLLAIPTDKSLVILREGGWDSNITDEDMDMHPAPVILQTSVPVTHTIFNHESTMVAGTLYDGRLVIWDIETQTMILECKYAESTLDAEVNAIQWAVDTDIIFVLRGDGTIVSIPVSMVSTGSTVSTLSTPGVSGQNITKKVTAMKTKIIGMNGIDHKDGNLGKSNKKMIVSDELNEQQPQAHASTTPIIQSSKIDITNKDVMNNLFEDEIQQPPTARKSLLYSATKRRKMTLGDEEESHLTKSKTTTSQQPQEIHVATTASTTTTKTITKTATTATTQPIKYILDTDDDDDDNDMTSSSKRFKKNPTNDNDHDNDDDEDYDLQTAPSSYSRSSSSASSSDKHTSILPQSGELDFETSSELISNLSNTVSNYQQEPFQPAAFPLSSILDSEHNLPIALLAYSPIGLVLSTATTATPTTSTTTTTFGANMTTNTSRRVAVSFTNPQMICPPLPSTTKAQGPYILSSLTKTGIALATAGSTTSLDTDDDNTTSTINKKHKKHARGVGAIVSFIPFTSWHSDVGFSITLPLGEHPISLLLTDTLCLVVTSARYLRMYTFCGLEQGIISLPGDILTLAGSGSTVAIVYQPTIGIVTSSLATTPQCDIFNVESNRLISTFPIALSVDSTLQWIGFNESGILFTYDSRRVLRMLQSSYGNTWIPVLEMNTSIWPLHIQKNQLVYVTLQKGKKLPAIRDSRLFSVLHDFKIPLVPSFQDETLQTRYSNVLLTKTMNTEISFIEKRELEKIEILTPDSHIVALIAKTVITNIPLTLELAGMIESSQMLEKAIEIINKLAKYPELVVRMQLMLELIRRSEIEQQQLQQQTQHQHIEGDISTHQKQDINTNNVLMHSKNINSGLTNVSTTKKMQLVSTPSKKGKIGAELFD